jgi:hypothetical protein
MPDAVEVRAVLDCSAALSYARGHAHIGELLIEIADEYAFVGLPALALLDAYTQVGADTAARGRLAVLAALPVVAVLALGSYEAAEVAPIVPLVKGDMSRAHALWAALEEDAYYVTVEPHLVPKAMADIKLLAIPAEDA